MSVGAAMPATVQRVLDSANYEQRFSLSERVHVDYREDEPMTESVNVGLVLDCRDPEALAPFWSAACSATSVSGRSVQAG